ncbi:MAG TPA: hypothetical protein VLV45_15155, partial [Gemmatimonadales bacterium]|nr:hypothetical protein [Gemmatimonadales bacterium]
MSHLNVRRMDASIPRDRAAAAERCPDDAAARARTISRSDNRLTCWHCYGHNAQFTGGAAFDLATRFAPFFAWRHSVIARMGTVLALGALYQMNNYFG